VAELSLFPNVQLPPALNATSTDKTPSDVYRELWSVSLALDPVLGIRGLKPTDVYAQSLTVLEQVKFLRITQNEQKKIPKPKRSKNKHPNHSLAQTYALLSKIATAEQNLWIDPVHVPTVPKREILSGEVYDALQIVRAELERIKFRLGVERRFNIPLVEGIKTPDDVIANLKWATLLMPDFDHQKTLQQYSQSSLIKTSNHVYATTEKILKDLERYRLLRGIKVTPRKAPNQTDLQPLHVFQKTLECLNKTNELRQHLDLGPMALTQHPLRSITPTEVYELALRLDAELGILYAQIGMTTNTSMPTFDINATNKTPSDVFKNMWAISYMIDTVLGSSGYTPSDVFNQARKVVAELTIILLHIGSTEELPLPPFEEGKNPQNVLALSDQLIQMLKRIKFRAGILKQVIPIPPKTQNTRPDDVYNQLGVIISELVNLKVHLGINKRIPVLAESREKTPSHVFQQLRLAQQMMNSAIHENKQ